MHLGLSLIEPHSRVSVDVLQEAVKEDDPICLVVFGGMVALTAEDRNELRTGLEEVAALTG